MKTKIIKKEIECTSKRIAKKLNIEENEKVYPDLTFSRSTVSRLTKGLDPQIKKWKEERLREHYIYLFSDDFYFYARENQQVGKRPLLISVWIDTSGHRKILG